MTRSRRWTPSELGGVASRLSGGSVVLHSASELEAMNSPRTKYGNRTAVDEDGRRFDSKLELRYAQKLDLEWQAGAVAWYTRQVPFLLEGGVTYRADFLVVRPTDPFGSRAPSAVLIEIIDCKGVMTQESRNKMKQVQARYGIIVMISRYGRDLMPYSHVPVTRRKAA